MCEEHIRIHAYTDTHPRPSRNHSLLKKERGGERDGSITNEGAFFVTGWIGKKKKKKKKRLMK